MTTGNLITLVAAVLAFIASVIAASVTLYNARFRRFARERWWDRRVDAYTKIIDALSSLVYYYEEHYEAESERRGLSAEYKQELQEHWRKGYAEVKRATAVGSFLISPEAAAALEKMWRDKGKDVHPDDWFAVMESDYKAASDALTAFVTAAKRDLKGP